MDPCFQRCWEVVGRCGSASDLLAGVGGASHREAFCDPAHAYGGAASDRAGDRGFARVAAGERVEVLRAKQRCRQASPSSVEKAISSFSTAKRPFHPERCNPRLNPPHPAKRGIFFHTFRKCRCVRPTQSDPSQEKAIWLNGNGSGSFPCRNGTLIQSMWRMEEERECRRGHILDFGDIPDV